MDKRHAVSRGSAARSVAIDHRHRSLARAIAQRLPSTREWALGSAGLLLALLSPGMVRAQATQIGPGNITTGQSVGAANSPATVVGNTTITTTSTTATSVNGGGELIFDPSTGAIAVTTTTGTGIYDREGTVDVLSPGLTVTSGGGYAIFAYATLERAAATTTISQGANLNVTGVGAALAANGLAATINANNVAINLSGGSGRGAVAQDGGTITLAGGSITSSGTALNALAFGAANTSAAAATPSTLTVTSPVTVNLNSPGAIGVYMYGGGVVSLPANQTFNFNPGSGVGGTGMVVDNSQVPTTALGAGLTFNFNAGASGAQNSGIGVLVINGGSVTLNNLTVAGSNAGVGVMVRNGSSATLSGGTITIGATPTWSFYTLNNGGTLASSSGGTVGPTYQVTAGTNNAGLRSDGGVLTASGIQVTASAANSAGAYAWSSTTTSGSSNYAPAVINLTGATINNTGSGSFGLYATDGGQISTFGGSSPTTITASNGTAVRLLNYGTRTTVPFISLSDTDVVATGASTRAISSSNVSASQQNVITLSNTQVSSDFWAVLGYGPLQLNASQGSLVQGTTGLLYAGLSSGSQSTYVHLNADDSTLSGLAEAGTTNLADISLANHSSWTGEAYYVTNVNVDATSSWTIPEDSLVYQTLTNAGLVQFTAPDAYKQLYVGSYVGAGGTLGIHTYLADDSSPTDRLIINGGTATGHSFIAVTNTGGPGALTSGNGIPVVEVTAGGTTNADAFSLAGPVVAGPYEYTLARGGISEGTEQYWFLRSTRDCGTVSSHPDCPAPPSPPSPPAPPAPEPPAPDPADPPTPPPVPGPAEPESPTAPEGVPNYRPEVSLYTALPALALRYGWATLDNLHERVGDEEQLRDRSDLRDDNYLNALWVRVIGEDGNVRGASQGIYNGSPQYDYNIMAFQAGMDVFAEEHENQQRDHAGFYLGTGRIRSDVDDWDGSDAGRDEVKGQSLGLYWTHFWSEGQYLDAVWQGTWSKQSAMSNEGLELHRSGFGWAGSVEGGYPFHDDSQVWEPQAQVIYQRFNNGQASDAAATVQFNDITSLVGRVGLRWANTWTLDPTSDGIRRLFTGWLRFNLWKEFQGQPTTSFSSEDGFVPFDGSIKGSWWQLNGGMTWQLDKNTSFYANVGYQKGFNSQGFHAWDGKVGFRWNW